MTDHFPLLSLLLWLPLAGAGLVVMCGHVRLAQWLAGLTASLTLVASLVLVALFNTAEGGMQFTERYAWIPALPADIWLGVDGLSLLFLPLTALVTGLALIATHHTLSPSRWPMVWLLVAESAVLGIFTALDLLLLLFFWHAALAAVFFLTGTFGAAPLKRNAACKFLLVNFCGSLPLMLAFILLALNHAQQINSQEPLLDLSFAYPVLLETPTPDSLQPIVFWLLMLGFAARTPLVPLHTWLPQLALAGPASALAQVLGLELGMYGILRFAMGLTPTAAVQYDWLLGIIGAATLVYGALLALRQDHWQRLLAFTSIAHTGLVLIGFASLNLQGLQGALLHLLNVPLVLAGLLLLAGWLQQRGGGADWANCRRLANTSPRWAGVYFVLVAALLGVPGGNVFPADLLLVLGALQAHPSLGMTALVGMVLVAAAWLIFSRRVWLGGSSTGSSGSVTALGTKETWLMVSMLLLLLLLGLWPNFLLTINAQSANVWLNHLLEQPGMEGDELASLSSVP